MITEDIIWNNITDSAKRKFDYQTFSETFENYHSNIAENIIFQIIIGLANNKSELKYELNNQLFQLGIKWDVTEISSFIDEKKNVFKNEIYATQLAMDLLQNGNEPIAVLNSIQFLIT